VEDGQIWQSEKGRLALQQLELTIIVPKDMSHEAGGYPSLQLSEYLSASF
jgi:hypothetical protein